ncbi:MAG: ankyrin repeat domain-containing protein [Bacteroidales bacterium]|nr:ankyrin repeat domain-containing protein [Bacteroidales bacterium]
MKNNQKHQKQNIRIVFLAALFLIFSTAGIRSQSCDKAANKSEEKPLTEKLADYVWNGDLDKIKELVEENNDLVDARLKNEETMLTLAAWRGNYDMAEYLVSKKANVNCRNDWQNTPLHNAAQKGYNDIITLLLNNGANVNARGTNGNNSLFFAVENDHLESAQLLLKAGGNIHATNDYDQTPLARASWNGNAEIIRFLAENGADVNFANSNGNTIMHNLASGGHSEAIKIIQGYGANANRINSDGRIPLHHAVINKKSEVVSLLLSKTQNINLQENRLGNTPLHIAAINGDLKSTELLIKAGAKADSKNYAQKTPLDYAIQYGYVEVVDYYLSNSLATEEALLAAKEKQSSGIVTVNDGEAKVIYCGHSGWVIQTEKHLLIFDYWNMNKPDKPGLANGSVCPEEIKDLDVIVFVSHEHSDHYDTCIYQWADQVINITYVYGFKPEEAWIHHEKGYHGPEYVYINDNQAKQIDDITITTLKSNDSGQGFLVSADGITIYHPGDHAWFSAEDEMVFKKEVDFIADQEQQIDIAFLPVTGCPSRWKKEFIVKGFFYSIDKLDPVQVFPMHAFQREYSLREFAELADNKKIESHIVCTENNGDSFSYTKTMVASK